MPLLSNAKKLFVGGTSINKVFSNGFVVWPKVCSHTSGRPNPLPPANNELNFPCDNTYYQEFGSIKVGWSRWGNDGRYAGYQCDLFDTESCEWVKQGVTPTDLYSSFDIDKAYIKDFQTYDARVTGVFSATGLPDEAMWRYANTANGSVSPYATVPSRAPSVPFFVTVYPSYPAPGSVRLQWTASTPPEAYGIEGYRIEIKLASSSTWELFRETTGPSCIYDFTEADGLVLGTRYVFRVAGITTICLSQSGFTESDPFLFN